MRTASTYSQRTPALFNDSSVVRCPDSRLSGGVESAQMLSISGAPLPGKGRRSVSQASHTPCAHPATSSCAFYGPVLAKAEGKGYKVASVKDGTGSWCSGITRCGDFLGERVCAPNMLGSTQLQLQNAGQPISCYLVNYSSNNLRRDSFFWTLKIVQRGKTSSILQQRVAPTNFHLPRLNQTTCSKLAHPAFNSNISKPPIVTNFLYSSQGPSIHLLVAQPSDYGPLRTRYDEFRYVDSHDCDVRYGGHGNCDR